MSGWLWLSGLGDRLNRIGSSVSWVWWLTPWLGDSSVGEVLTTQVWGQEFKTLSPQEKYGRDGGVFANPVPDK